MNDEELTPQIIKDRIDNAISQLGSLVSISGITTIKEKWTDWESNLKNLCDEIKKKPKVAISFVGSARCGKSSLINALLGCRVLPVGTARPYTSSICHVSKSTEIIYKAVVKFVSKESWEKEIKNLIQDINDNNNIEGKNSFIQNFISIFKSSNQNSKLLLPELTDSDKHKLEILFGDLSELDFNKLNNYHIPEKIEMFLNKGEIIIEKHDMKDFKDEITKYITATDIYWSIIKEVFITGPFPGIQDDLFLIDLPGLNDPNEMREEITKKYLKECKYIFIVYNIKNSLGSEHIEILTTDFFRHLFLDGRSNTLTFIGTASDDISVDDAIEEFHLNENSTEIDAIKARNNYSKSFIRETICKLIDKLSDSNNPSSNLVNEIIEKIKETKILTTSAIEYLRLEKLTKAHPKGIVEKDDTEIPQLKNHINNICEEFSIQAHLAAISRRVDTVLEEIKQTLQMHKIRLEQYQQLQEEKRKEVEKAALAAQAFLEQEIKSAIHAFQTNLDADYRVLEQRLKRGIDRGWNELDRVLDNWNRLHWGTLRGTVRRNGVFRGSASGAQDFPRDLSEPILKELTFSWAEFFQNLIEQRSNEGLRELLDIGQNYGRELERNLSSIDNLPPTLLENINKLQSSMKNVLQEKLAQVKTEMSQKIEEKQRTLWQQIPEQVKNDLLPIFELAASEKGTGMRQRIMDILRRNTKNVAQEMFQQCETSISEGIRGLNQLLGKRFGEMAQSVRGNSETVSQNLRSETEQLSVSDLELERSALKRISDVVVSLAH